MKWQTALFSLSGVLAICLSFCCIGRKEEANSALERESEWSTRADQTVLKGRVSIAGQCKYCLLAGDGRYVYLVELSDPAKHDVLAADTKVTVVGKWVPANQSEEEYLQTIRPLRKERAATTDSSLLYGDESNADFTADFQLKTHEKFVVAEIKGLK